MAEPVAPIVASTSDAVVTQEPTAKKTQDYEDLFPKLPGAAPTSISGMLYLLFSCLFTFFLNVLFTFFFL